MAIFQKRTTSVTLAEAQAALAAAESDLARLQDERTVALGNDDVAAARRLDRQIAEQREARTTYVDRVALLQTKLRREQREQRAADYQAAVDRIEADLLPPRAAAAAELETALKAVAVAARKLKEAGDAVRKNWPAKVPQPSNHFLGMDRVGERIKACFQPGLLVRKYTLQEAERREFTERVFEVDRRADGLAVVEAEQHVRLLAEIRARGVPEVADDQEAA